MRDFLVAKLGKGVRGPCSPLQPVAARCGSLQPVQVRAADLAVKLCNAAARCTASCAAHPAAQTITEVVVRRSLDQTEQVEEQARWTRKC